MIVDLNEKRKKQVENIICKKVAWHFWLVLIVWVIVLLVAIVAECCAKTDSVAKMIGENIDKFYDLVVTISTILTAAVVFFYGIIDSKRLGVANRTIISYYVGGYTIPIWFILTLINLLILCLCINAEYVYVAVAETGYLFLLQLGIIFLILMSTSYRKHIKAICKIEKKQLLLMLECVENDEEPPWIYMVHHMESIAGSDSLFLDKSQMICELLKVPLKVENQTGVYWKKVIYKYYYQNLSELFGRISAEQELEKIYEILYEFAQENAQRSLDDESRSICILVNSAILNAALDSGTVGKSGFCKCFINKYVNDEMRNKQIILFYLFHELMCGRNINIIDEQTIKSLNFVGELKEELEEMEDECRDFWEIWAEQYRISIETSTVGFSNAMCTLEGKNQKSYPMMYIKNLLRKKER